jgi:DNA-binding PucR family transcriptional regulator
VPVTALPATLDLVSVALRLRRSGHLVGNPVYAADHLDVLIVHRDERLHEALSMEALAPLAGLAPDARERLSATLRCWLDHLGDTAAMAAELHVHPQTVRYRMGQLRDLFGHALDDPAQRRRLVLALCFTSADRDR